MTGSTIEADLANLKGSRAHDHKRYHFKNGVCRLRYVGSSMRRRSSNAGGHNRRCMRAASVRVVLIMINALGRVEPDCQNKTIFASRLRVARSMNGFSATGKYCSVLTGHDRARAVAAVSL